MMMNVLYLTMNPNRASTTVATEGWFRLLRPRGLNPVVASDLVGAFHDWAVGEGIPAYHVPLPPPSKSNPVRSLRSLWALRRLVRRHRIELIHCNEQNIYPIGRVLGRVTGLPVVASVHCAMERGFSTWAFGRGRPPRRLFFVSRANQETCRPGLTGVVPEDRWRVLYNGLDLDHYRPDPARGAAFRAEHGLGAGPVVGVACALRAWKQLEHLFDAAARADVPGLKVLLAGGAVPWEPAGYAEAVLADGRARLGDRLVPVGHLTELRGFYNALDLFVNTSKQEACSISVLEALACGCPVIGYPSESVAEQILPDAGGVVEQDRPDLLADLIRKWVADPDRVAQARVAARRRAEEWFDIRRLADFLWDEYTAVLAEWHGTPRPAAAAVGGATA
jgi:glycosyltransferase involved in cell wall biosynthesis